MQLNLSCVNIIIKDQNYTMQLLVHTEIHSMYHLEDLKCCYQTDFIDQTLFEGLRHAYYL